MKVSAATTSQRVERNVWNTPIGIKAYGKDDDYPQKILDIVSSSGTGKTCLDIYIKFIVGVGFRDEVFGATIINSRREKANTLLSKCAKDLKYFNGFAVLVKYDGLGLPTEYYNVPFEHCRIQVDSSKKYTGKIGIHSDWTGITGIAFHKTDIKWVTRFNPETVLTEMTEVGGPEEYFGQLYYFTADGDFEYPVSPFDPIITDMLTEESVSTVKYRNARYNFLPAGILIRKGKAPHTKDDGTIDPNDPYNQEQEASANMIRRMQGDANTSKIWVVDVDADEEKPEFIEFDAKNYDKQFELTETTVQENIGKMFMIPPILRGIDVGAGFGADLMTNAYDVMNSITTGEREMIEDVFVDLFEYYMTQFTDFSILPLKYITTVGTVATNEIIPEP